MIGRLLPIFVVVSVLTGCTANPFKKSEPLVEKKELTVDAALKDITVGLINMQQTLDQNNKLFGIYVDSIDVDLVLDTTHDEKGNAKLTVNPLDFTSLSKSPANISIDESKQILDKRNSTVKIHFKSLYTLPNAKIPDLDCKVKDKNDPRCKTIFGGKPTVDQ